MIWGAIGLNFKSKLMFIDGTVTSDYYFNEILIGSNVFDDADKVYGKGRWVFQQDNACPHISNETLMSLDIIFFCKIFFIFLFNMFKIIT